MREHIGLLIIIIIAIAIITVFGYIRGNEEEIKNINFASITETLKADDLAIVYFGDFTDEKKDDLESIIKNKDIKIYTSNASIDELNSILVVNTITVETNDVYVLFINADPVGYVVGHASKSLLRETINELFFDEIPTSKIAYITPSSKEFIKKVNSKKYTIAVYAKDDCIYCTKFLPVINKIASDYNIEVNYFNRSTYDKEEYDNIMALDLKIPAKCTMNNTDTTMLSGFPKPMTIITKNGKLVDCIKGNVSEATVLEMLEKYGIIKRD